MPEISVTEAQGERLETVREDVEEAFVDTYGKATLQDAVEYLLDTYTPPDQQESAGAYDLIADAEYPELQHVASEVEDVPGSGISADEMRGKILSELGPRAFASKLEAATDEESSTAPAGGTETASDEEARTDPDPADESASEDGEADSSVSDHSEGGLLTAANQLLREHDDKWAESDGDTPYEVELPDGTTEAARTKDDVRQLLFRHY